MNRPFEGVRILDFTRLLDGPFGTCRCAVNGNRRSMPPDLRRPEARAPVQRMVRDADIVRENFRPGAMDRLVPGHERPREINPRPIRCAVEPDLRARSRAPAGPPAGAMTR